MTRETDEYRTEIAINMLQLVIDEYYNGNREWAKQCLEEAYAALEEFVTKDQVRSK